MGERWRSKADVMKDLAAMSGANYIDDRYIVIGDQKPHLVAEVEDLELDERYRDATASDCPPTPDYNCITQMLRQVDDYDDQENPQVGFNKVGINNNNNTVFEISKSNLNPHSEAFVPRTIKQPDDERNLGIEEKAREIKAQISEASKENSTKGRIAKNVAISSLLSLYSSPRNGTDKNCVTPKLLTPEAFETPQLTDPVNNIDNVDNHVGDGRHECCIDDQSLLESLEKVNCWLDSTNNHCKLPETSLDDPVQSASDDSRQSMSSKSPVSGLSPKHRVSPSASVNQVVGSGMFKKKLSKQSSTNRNGAGDCNGQPKSNAYVPSVYADTLLQKYNKNKERAYQKLDIWSKLEWDLKEKDRKIKTQNNKALSRESPHSDASQPGHE